MKTTTIHSIISALMLSCIAISAMAQSDDDLKEKIRIANQEIARAMMEGNTQKSLSYYSDDAISMPNNSKMVQGIDAIKKSTEETVASGMKVKSFEVKTVKIETCGNFISEIGNYKISFSVPGMASDMGDVGKYLTIWEKQSDGSLKIKLEIWNTDTNPMEQKDLL